MIDEFTRVWNSLSRDEQNEAVRETRIRLGNDYAYHKTKTPLDKVESRLRDLGYSKSKDGVYRTGYYWKVDVRPVNGKDGKVKRVVIEYERFHSCEAHPLNAHISELLAA